ncbi:choice-of-anchor J domain-containing protein [Candidatus Sumerlaeota bacterium]|nr:choice-of-anchor J domain-containing protein [Candidatus Sumerlaeota bacterium]
MRHTDPIVEKTRRPIRIATVCIVVFAALLAGNAQARQVGPDGYGYIAKDETEPGGPAFQWVDISGTGVLVVQGDDQGASVTLPAGKTFPFYGRDYSVFAMTTNGYISTDPDDNGPDVSNDWPLPATPSTPGGTTGARIYVLHDDIRTTQTANSGCYYQYFDEAPRPHDSGEPMGCSVFLWHNVVHYGSVTTQMFSFEAFLYDNGDMVFQYGPGNPEEGAGSTTGIQSPSPAPVFGLGYSGNEAGSIIDGRAIWFSPADDVRVSKRASHSGLDLGESFTYFIEVDNHGTAETHATLVDTLPPDVGYLSDTAGVGPPTAGVWTWDLGLLAPGDTRACTMTVAVVEPGSTINTAEVFSERIDIDSSNNVDTCPSYMKVGAESFRISHMGPDGVTSFSALLADVAWNSTDDQYLVVWSGSTDTGGLVEEEFEIFGRLLDGAGNTVRPDFRISQMGSDGETSTVANSPAVAYNAANNSYLVVWSGSETTPGEFEIYGIPLGPNGNAIASRQKLSAMGPDGDPAYGAYQPDVVYDSTENRYLVVWYGADDAAPLVAEEFEIFGKLVGPMGTDVTGMSRLSDMGPDGDPGYSAFNPCAAYNPANRQFLVAWHGDDNTGALADDEFEIFGQRLLANGSEAGSDFRISTTGADGLTTPSALNPAVAYSSIQNRYVVVWQADDPLAGLADGEFEIFGRRIGNTGTLLGSQQRISQANGTGDPLYDAMNPCVAYNNRQNEYLVGWDGNVASGYRLGTAPEDFADITALDGWSQINHSEPLGVTNWFQGNGAVFPAQSGAANAYIAANYNNTAGVGTISNWLITPPVRLENGGRFSFYTRGPSSSSYPDRLEVRRSMIDSVDVGTSSTHVGDFTELLLSIDPDLQVGGYPNEWTRYEIPMQNIDEPTTGRLALRYYVTDAGPSGSNSDYIGIDSVFYESRGETETFVQRLDASNGQPLGPGNVRVSRMGPSFDPRYGATDPVLAYNPTHDECLMAWRGNDNLGGLVHDEFEIFAQRLLAGPEIASWNAPSGLDFGDVELSSGPTWPQTARFKNVGVSDLLYGPACDITGPNASDFIIGLSPASGPFSPDGVIAIDVMFDPSATGLRQATLNVYTDDADEPAMSVPLAGYGIFDPLTITDLTRPGYTTDTLFAGRRLYGDRTYVFQDPIPPGLEGQVYIKTLNADKDLTPTAPGADLFSFQVNRPVAVYVSLHENIVDPPSWLLGWSGVGDTLPTTDGARNLFMKEFPAGTIGVGYNRESGMPTGRSMYNVVVAPRSTGARHWSLFE